MEMNTKIDHENNGPVKKPIRLSVRLRDIIEAMEMQSDEMLSYLNVRTGETVTLMDESSIESGEYESLFGIEAAEEARAKLKEKENLIALPDRFEINEYRIMEYFALSITPVKTSNTLLVAIQGPGAFRRFKDLIKTLEVEQEWYDFRNREYEKIAVEWCEYHGIEYER
jgi:hypothetical protein